MAKFYIFAKAVSHTEFEQIAEIDQVVVNAATDDVRNNIAAHMAERWAQDNGAGIIEFRNDQAAILIRITRP